MPNWVSNYMTIRKQDAALLINKDENGNDYVDFNIVVPMPEELQNTISGGEVHSCVEYCTLKKAGVNFMRQEELLKNLDEGNIRMYNSELYDGEYHHTIEEVGNYYLSLKEKYGCKDWYEWSNRNWGVKWNASDSRIIELGNDLLELRFSTPWGPPAEFLEKLAEKIPFHLAWEEEQGYRGLFYVEKQGALEEMELPMLMWEETEDGELLPVEDEYGEDWFSLNVEFMQDTLSPDYQFEEKDFELEQ